MAITSRISPLSTSCHRVLDVTGDQRGDLAATIADGLEAGATGICGPVWSTADGVAVVHPTGKIRSGLRKKPLRSLALNDLDTSAMRSIDIAAKFPKIDVIAFRIARSVDERVTLALHATEHWLLTPSPADLPTKSHGQNQTVVATRRLNDMRPGPERYFAEAANKGIAGVETYHTDWNGGLVTLAHRFGLMTIASGAEQPRVFAQLIDAGIDAIITTNIDALSQIARQFDQS